MIGGPSRCPAVQSGRPQSGPVQESAHPRGGHEQLSGRPPGPRLVQPQLRPTAGEAAHQPGPHPQSAQSRRRRPGRQLRSSRQVLIQTLGLRVGFFRFYDDPWPTIVNENLAITEKKTCIPWRAAWGRSLNDAATNGNH